MADVQVGPRREALASEWTFAVMAWLVVGMGAFGLLGVALGGGLGALVLLGYGVQLSVLALVPLLWAVVRRRGRVDPMVRRALLAWIALAAAFTLIEVFLD